MSYVLIAWFTSYNWLQNPYMVSLKSKEACEVVLTELKKGCATSADCVLAFRVCWSWATIILVTSKQAVETIAKLLQSLLKKDKDECMRAAEKIYADVVAPSVDDEREKWIAVVYHQSSLDH